MRLLSLNSKDKTIDYLQDNELYICDIASDIEDAMYHAEVRHYNMILINDTDIKKMRHLLSKINPKITAAICIVDNIKKEDEISLLDKGALTIINDTTNEALVLAKIEATHRENFLDIYTFKNGYTINKGENSISDDKDNKVIINGKPFSILEYLIKNRHRPVISKEELLDVLWDDPEWVVKNVIEVNINLIRKNIQNTFEDNFINTVRHRGYQIV